VKAIAALRKQEKLEKCVAEIRIPVLLTARKMQGKIV
jgi:hypothetical protein